MDTLPLSAHGMPSDGGSTLEELGVLLRLAVPIGVAQLGLMTMTLVETAAVGRVSVDDLAAVGIARSIGFATMVLGMGVGIGLEPLAAQAVGAGERGRAWQGFVTSVRASLLLWPVTMGIALAATLALPRFGIAAPVVQRAQWFLIGQAPGFAASLAFFAAKTFLQAHGHTRPALLGSLVANVVNVPVTCILVRGDAALLAVGLAPRGLPALGALGAGIAFSISCVVLLAFVGVAALAYREEEKTPRIPLAAIYRLGIPVGLQMAAEVGVFSIVGLLSGVLGPEVAAAHHVAIGLAGLTFMGATGVAGATSVRVGHAIGAGRSPRRVGALGIAIGCLMMGLGAIAFATAPRLLAELFTNDESVISIGIGLIRIAAAFQIFDGMQAVSAGALRGAGDVRFPFLANLAAHWLVGFPAAIFFGFVLHTGARGLWWGLTAGTIFIAFLLTARFAWITRREIARV